MRRSRRPTPRRVLAAGLLCSLALATYAQDASTGLHYFAIENLDRRAVDQRGTAGANGIAFSNLILAPNTKYRAWILKAETLDVGWVEFTTPNSGQRFEVPDITLRLASSHDTDSDGLHDQGEFVMGTDARNADTDGDGIKDGAEVQQGSNPLDGLATQTGIIASADTPGRAVDVCATNDVVVVADSDRGIAVFNVFNAMNPIMIAAVDTPGDARRVSCAGTRVAVADGPGGLAIVDISDPPNARIAGTVSKFLLGGDAISVVAVDNVAFVGLSSGNVVSVDLRTAMVLERVSITTSSFLGVSDVFIAGDTLFAIDSARLYALTYLGTPSLQVLGSVASPSASGSQFRVFAGGGVAYVTHLTGVNSFDVSNPATLTLLAQGATQQAGWEQWIVNGSGLAVAAVGPNSSGNRDTSVYDATDPAQTNVLVTTHPTPGQARANAIYNALAYTADGTSGVQTIRLQPQDALGVPPTITLSTSFGATTVEEGKLARVTASVADDVAVRNVEFFLNGQRVATDGGFPFEHVFTTPLLADGPSFRLRARATDTGGNATFSAELVIDLTADATAPTVRATVPRNNAVLGRATGIALLVSEPLEPATLTEASLTLLSAGPDRVFGNADDVVVSGGTIEFRNEVLGAFRTFAAPLAAGRYRAQATTAVTDKQGNALAAAETWEFEVFDVGVDSDGDGVPDALEAALGLDPANPDTNGDGTPDGLEDADGDGLVNLAEVLFGTDPLSIDSDGNGVADGDEDRDADLLTDSQEFTQGTDPFDPDSDDDGFEDGPEVANASNPLDPNSLPIFFAISDMTLRADNAASIREAYEDRVIKNEAAPAAISGDVEGPTFSAERP